MSGKHPNAGKTKDVRGRTAKTTNPLNKQNPAKAETAHTRSPVFKPGGRRNGG